MGMASTLLVPHWRLIGSFVRRDLQARFLGSALGLFWSVIHPALLLGIFYFLFSVILQVRWGTGGSGAYALYLFAGMLPWLAFQEALLRSAQTVLDNRILVKKTTFPAVILPVYLTLSSLALHLVGLGLLLGVLLFGRGLTPWLLLLPLLLGLQVGFTVGLAWLIASLTVFFRDVAHLVGVVLTLWLYGTPIVYPETMVPAGLQVLLWVNPMRYLVAAYRAVLLDGQAPDGPGLVLLAAFSAGSFLLGSRLFHRLAPQFSDLL